MFKSSCQGVGFMFAFVVIDPTDLEATTAVALAEAAELSCARNNV